ncbi:hypothetical protein COU62_02570 [Candidatus Pacearchaeota archaeon CG10_big_fil_rev_8_21_14_0_10_35_219]|nr:hypothetical protein [Candidatus Pacearchaeota archaeon]OIO43346.1 MAG: hypothetical protein AUJ63_00435 [Candidatus Pacearchaeota archaeon CG1_02_35_32]PIO07724.1 MAG: hypothetical protein COU62_02570 [Candidatus Pacearchaeota archaeon CG10_big_fil_rev_8_21_14_0_10_35_219]PIY81494.1 MAG: hypothetical protein COY79_02015 [Candidatus Pacearchaeota archaeon CG_4_10_14_0_8_um_filter_35_169]PIZ80420.1 MAG: hypothetical protein COY00_01105 [Candidatus Pacearchaeota archaeon CG_4_10_14_0_2_um_filt
MDKKDLLKQLDDDFDKIKQEIGVELDELDEAFFVRDQVMQDGFVSNNLSRQLASKVAETLMNWNQYLHNLLFTAPGNMILMNESRMLHDDDKKALNSLISESMSFVSLNIHVGISKNKELEKEFFQKSLKFWNSKFSPEIEKITKKINSGWMKKD